MASLGITFDETPSVEFTPTAWDDLFYITDKVNDEVAVMGAVTRLSHVTFKVERIYLPKQEVHSATTEIQPMMLGEFYEEILDTVGVEEFNRLRLWAHSHVNMGVSASAQDKATLKKFVDDIGEPYIAVRTNKRGDITADIRYPEGYEVTGVECRVEREAYTRGPDWDAIIKQRVTKLVYPSKFDSPGVYRPATHQGYYDAKGNFVPYTPSQQGRYGQWPATQPQLQLPSDSRSRYDEDSGDAALFGLFEEKYTLAELQSLPDEEEFGAMLEESYGLLPLNEVPTGAPRNAYQKARQQLLAIARQAWLDPEFTNGMEDDAVMEVAYENLDLFIDSVRLAALEYAAENGKTQSVRKSKSKGRKGGKRGGRKQA